ncbi:MAG: M48 family metalloprotease [Terracidiphilus sp.]|jgi:Zn-dependent protease with chaperone function
MTFTRGRLLCPRIAFLINLLLFVAPAPFRCAGQPVSPAPAAAQATNQPSSHPTAQAYTLPPDKLAKAIALGHIRNVLGIGGSLWDLVVLWLLLTTRAAAGLETWAKRLSSRRWLQGVIFFAAFLIILALADLPLDLYGHHVSLSYGISVEGWGPWLVDMTKSLALTLCIGAPVLLLFNWIVRRWPRRYWLVCWMTAVPLIVLSTFLEPLAEPIFNQYEPLSKNHAALVADLEKVVARTGTNIPPDRMYLMKASEKSNGINAYVSGIGATKRIVVWDTTADRIPNDEIMLVFAHESGHYVLHHIPKGLAISAVVFFFVFWVCARIAAWFVRRLGPFWRVESLSTRTGFVALLFVASIANFLLGPAGNAVSRHFEHQADVFGQEAIHSLVPDPQNTAVAAFSALGAAWLDDPNPHPFIEFWLDSHPSIQSRATFALHYNPWANGGHGEFFDR